MQDILTFTRAILSSTPTRWNSLAQTVPVALLQAQPAPGEWSALMCLQHLIDTERNVFAKRVTFFLEGKDFPGFNPESDGSQMVETLDPLELADEFTSLRATSLELLGSLTVNDLTRTVRHQGLGPVTLEQMLNEWAAHDLVHTIQAEQALMQPFIAGSGPWRIYFTEHIISV
jgi:hypothetical protein